MTPGATALIVSTLIQLVTHAPVLLVWIVGLGLAAIFGWRKTDA